MKALRDYQSAMRIANAKIRDAVFNGIPSTGPPSLKSRWARARYVPIDALNEAFAESLKVIEKDSSAHKARAAELGKQNAPAAEVEAHRAKAEIQNPEVRYNHLIGRLDLTQPVYRHLALRDWQARPMPLLMQRIEQHHVIPDTMPTLDPRADVQMQFLTPNRRWVEPGEWIANDVCERLPLFKVVDFSATADQLYSVVIVNPDAPDLDRDSFKTQLHFAAVNVAASPGSPVCNFTDASILADYRPPFPEKNAPHYRMCVWVFRQAERLSVPEIPARDYFDIRNFANRNNLDAVGAHMWRTRWDLSTPDLREKYGLDRRGTVYFRARTAHPENALLHIRDRRKWIAIADRAGQAQQVSAEEPEQPQN